MNNKKMGLWMAIGASQSITKKNKSDQNSSDESDSD